MEVIGSENDDPEAEHAKMMSLKARKNKEKRLKLLVQAKKSNKFTKF